MDINDIGKKNALAIINGQLRFVLKDNVGKTAFILALEPAAGPDEKALSLAQTRKLVTGVNQSIGKIGNELKSTLQWLDAFQTALKSITGNYAWMFSTATGLNQHPSRARIVLTSKEVEQRLRKERLAKIKKANATKYYAPLSTTDLLTEKYSAKKPLSLRTIARLITLQKQTTKKSPKELRTINIKKGRGTYIAYIVNLDNIARVLEAIKLLKKSKTLQLKVVSLA